MRADSPSSHTKWVSPIDEAPPPVEGVYDDVWMILNYTCDAECKLCYVRGAEPRFKPKAQIFAEIEFARSVSKGERIGFSGGEPSLRQDLFEIIRFARRQGFTYVHLFTHGRRFSEHSYAKTAAEAGLTGTMISVHGSNPTTNDWLMGNPGTEKTWMGIENLTKIGVRVIVNLVANRMNLDEIIPLYHRCAGLTPPLTEFRVTYPSLQRAALEHIDLACTYEEVILVLAELFAQPGSLPTFAEVFPICILPEGEKRSIEWWFRHQVDYMSPSDRCGNHHDRIWSRECMECRNRFVCTGMQREYVRRFGAPRLSPRTEPIARYD